MATRTLAALVMGLAVAAGTAPPAPEGQPGSESLSPCQACVMTIEKIKQGTNTLLPSICTGMYEKNGEAAYSKCHETLSALEQNGNNFRFWLFEGCYKYEVYQSKEWIKPCPTHVICSVIKGLSQEPFCPPLAMENPFGGAPAPP